MSGCYVLPPETVSYLFESRLEQYISPFTFTFPFEVKCSEDSDDDASTKISDEIEHRVSIA
jgi:hypothetical protein